MLIYHPIRYTDFLVNEILPSGVVVHLDNLKPPQLGKVAEKSSNAKIPSFDSVGTASVPCPSISEPTSSARNNDDGFHPDASSQHFTTELKPSHNTAEIGTFNSNSHERDNDDESQLTKQGQRKLDLQPASGPRQKEKILMRQTSSELVLVRDNEEAHQQSPSQASGSMGNDHMEDQGSSQTSALLKKEVVGDGEDAEDKDAQEPSRTLAQPSSPADWQVYADGQKGFQVGLQLYTWNCQI